MVSDRWPLHYICGHINFISWLVVVYNGSDVLARVSAEQRWIAGLRTCCNDAVSDQTLKSGRQHFTPTNKWKLLSKTGVLFGNEAIALHLLRSATSTWCCFFCQLKGENKMAAKSVKDGTSWNKRVRKGKTNICWALVVARGTLCHDELVLYLTENKFADSVIKWSDNG